MPRAVTIFRDFLVAGGYRSPMEDSARFEQLLSDLSTRFTGIAAEAVDSEVERALRRVVEFLGTDRSTLFEFSADGMVLQATHSWGRPDVAPFAIDIIVATELPWYHDQLTRGSVVRLGCIPEELPSGTDAERAYIERVGMRSNLSVPIAVGGRFVCALATGAFGAPRAWSDSDVERVRVVGQIVANAIHRKRADEALRASLTEVEQLKDRLEAENVYLREEVKSAHDFDEIVGQSPTIRQVLGRVAQVAPTSMTVLLLGETGTGKELLARAIHERSPRRDHPMVKVNCAAIPAGLLESELFGHERGAFTGAVSARTGRFEVADGGTLFLDEIGDLSMDLQAKLLRVLQAGEFERLGSTHTRKVNVRIVAATHRDLPRTIVAGGFREDLYYRLSVFPITLPPLRERSSDIPLLVWSIIHRRQGELGRRIERVPQRAMAALTGYAWPGNVRELENVIERALVLSPGSTLQVEEAFSAATPGGNAVSSADLDAVTAQHIRAVLERCGWRINGGGNAAAVLGLHPNTLRSRMKKLGIVRPPRNSEYWRS